MSFHEVRFPLALALGATGGPERMTDVARLASGAESRNARWQGSRRRWEAGGAAIRADQAHALTAFLRDAGRTAARLPLSRSGGLEELCAFAGAGGDGPAAGNGRWRYDAVPACEALR